MEDLAQPVTAEEQEALDKLPSASPGWQRAMAKKMAAASGSADVPLVEAETPAKNKDPRAKRKLDLAGGRNWCGRAQDWPWCLWLCWWESGSRESLT